MYNYLTSSPKRWTKEAKKCYFRGCRCVVPGDATNPTSVCDNYTILKDRCRMKRTVIDLVRKFGKPVQ